MPTPYPVVTTDDIILHCKSSTRTLPDEKKNLVQIPHPPTTRLKIILTFFDCSFLINNIFASFSRLRTDYNIIVISTVKYFIILI